MDGLKNVFENLKERLKAAWAEQQESALFIDMKERYEALPTLAQKGIVWGAGVCTMIFILWWPLSNLMDASDLNSKFDERRQVLKDLLKLQRDLSAQPMFPAAPPPSSFKPIIDGKIAGAGIKGDQIKVPGNEIPVQTVSGAEERGLQYRLGHVTIRQALDLSYELEHTDPSLRLESLEFTSDPIDPHFYEVGIKLVNFAPKVADLSSFAGKGLADAIKDKGGGKAAPAPPAPPANGGGG